MFSKAALLLTLIVAAQAGVVVDQHVGAQSEQTVRGLGFGGLGTVSHQQKAVDSAFSSVRKTDTRVTNPAYSVGVAAAPAHYAYHPQQVAYAAQPAVYQQAVYQPAVAKVAAPVAYAQPAHYAYPQAVAYAQPAAPVAYAQPAYAQPAVAAVPAVYSAAPVVKAAAPLVAAAPVAYAQPAYAPAVAKVHAPVAYAQPAYAPAVAKVHAPVAYASPAVAHATKVASGSLLGVAYSPVSPGVATLTFDGFGVHYGY